MRVIEAEENGSPDEGGLGLIDQMMESGSDIVRRTDPHCDCRSVGTWVLNLFGIGNSARQSRQLLITFLLDCVQSILSHVALILIAFALDTAAAVLNKRI